MKYELRATKVEASGHIAPGGFDGAAYLSLYRRVPQMDDSSLAEWIVDFPLAELKKNRVVFVEKGGCTHVNP